jgi:uncharacterized membrane protein YjdF
MVAPLHFQINLQLYKFELITVLNCCFCKQCIGGNFALFPVPMEWAAVMGVHWLGIGRGLTELLL